MPFFVAPPRSMSCRSLSDWACARLGPSRAAMAASLATRRVNTSSIHPTKWCGTKLRSLSCEDNCPWHNATQFVAFVRSAERGPPTPHRPGTDPHLHLDDVLGPRTRRLEAALPVPLWNTRLRN